MRLQRQDVPGGGEVAAGGLLGEQACRETPHRLERLTHGGEGGRGKSARENPVESSHDHVSRDADAFLRQRIEHLERTLVVLAHKSTR